MAKDGIHVHFGGGAALDRALTRIGNIKQSKASTIVNSSLSAGATQVKKGIARVTPVAEKDTTGFKTSSRNVTKGQLKRSLKSGLRKKVNVDRSTFLAGVWFQTKKGGASATADGFFAKQVLEKHRANAFGYTGGNNFLTKGVKASESNFKNKVGSSLAKKIAAFGQLEINKLG
jgi:hypothetical protein|tara:strand:- start:1838 stop:2359 length:522 start_codon:yes stop_codon:yes gene_type:complete